jgi:hypothetical protein
VGLSVAQYVDDVAIGVADEVPADAPRLVRQWLNDLSVCAERSGMASVHIVDLHGHVWGDRGSRLVRQKTQLRVRLSGIVRVATKPMSMTGRPNTSR